MRPLQKWRCPVSSAAGSVTNARRDTTLTVMLARIIWTTIITLMLWFPLTGLLVHAWHSDRSDWLNQLGLLVALAAWVGCPFVVWGMG